ncbi:hypothetical protein QT711_05485 [Sporosarcina saromensis]|uniref:Uncharacterized protein n=1 Tax=Sporosarcina saromensis TaxID=359365 RepID=A0ABU4GAL8_9BACL|nr:hypothetical protein [Sporosarcina saromensis]MDW0112627.1 hypothetical protein [Sporosarcina saromensis]
MNPNNENTIMQAIMELSGQLKEMKLELIGEMQAIRQDLNRVEERLSQDVKELDEKVDLVDAKLDVLSKALITTQADVLRLKQAK